MIEHFFVITLRGDVVLHRDYRDKFSSGDTGTASLSSSSRVSDIFWNHISQFDEKEGKLAPAARIENINFIFLINNDLYFVISTKKNISPFFGLELLNRIVMVFKDYSGAIQEEILRTNFVMLHELMDEMIDFGYPQITATEELKKHIHKEAAVMNEGSFLEQLGVTLGDVRIQSSQSANRPVSVGIESDRTRRNEIFVDLIERLNVTFDDQNVIKRSDINGQLVMRNFLKGDPEIYLSLNENLRIKNEMEDIAGGGGYVLIDHINFHQCCNLEHFERDRSIMFSPPEGEFVVLNYRISTKFNPPIKVYVNIEDKENGMIDLNIRATMDFPDTKRAASVNIQCPIPDGLESVSFDINNAAPTEMADHHDVNYFAHDKLIAWSLTDIKGESSYHLRAKMNFGEKTVKNLKWKLGPLRLKFEIAMHLCSGMRINSLKILERSENYDPYRWVRYLSQANSYTFRLR